MITRAWFALCILWALFWAAISWGRNPEPDVRNGLIILAVLPFLAGIIIKRIAFYVLTGSLFPPRTVPQNERSWPK
jgi:ABC-type spermidine/putrescine transport system permease subunit I